MKFFFSIYFFFYEKIISYSVVSHAFIRLIHNIIIINWIIIIVKNTLFIFKIFQIITTFIISMKFDSFNYVIWKFTNQIRFFLLWISIIEVSNLITGNNFLTVSDSRNFMTLPCIQFLLTFISTSLSNVDLKKLTRNSAWHPTDFLLS